MQCLKVFTVLSILLSICLLINAKCVENEKEKNNLECTFDDLKEVNNQRNKDKYRILKIQGLQTKKFDTTLDYPSITRLHITQSRQLEEIEPDVLSNLEALIYLTIDFTKLRIIKEKSFNNLHQLKELNLESNQIKKIERDAFETLSDLIFLDLSHNKLKKLESGIFDNLSNLQKLKLHSNEITQLPTDLLLNLFNLKEFYLSYNKLKTVADDTFKSTPFIQAATYKTSDSPLELIDLSGSNIEKITAKSFLHLPNLKTLDLHQNQIKDIDPKAFVELKNLQTLHLSVNSFGSKINQIDFSNLKKLTKLNLSFCKIKHFDGKTIKALKKLNSFEISFNELKEIPLNMFNYTKHLKELLIAGNQIKLITSSTFDNLKELRTLALDSNQIEDIESGAFLQLKSLIKLNLSRNKLKDIKVGTFDSVHSSGTTSDSVDVTSRLLELNLSFNQISSLNTAAFDPLRNLITLNLVANGIKKIPDNFFRRMTKLQILDLGYNKIKTLPENVFSPLGNSLVELQLSTNEFEYIKAVVFEPLEKLETLNLKKNQLKVLDVETFNLPSLRIVNLHSNRLTYLPPNLLHGDNCIVENFSVYFNRLTFVENAFFENTHLKQFSFGRNPFICKCLDEMINVLKSQRIQYYAQELQGGAPSCVITQNNTCIHDLSNSEEIFKQYNIILQQYPVMCTNPDLC
ncbi:leucine-rich repeats and immunoglobulin-like domains protein 1 [Chrysoperla carnea]|uniref:leucine-rich repeats and immunoglobulin-like domains protein 1 n=1 Tax=Chrysoperla carnea TaxID=189513 RepID=UPI001D07929C|nr:leucine-rich repeats and immunoglobulin-like domains protein 1 [Chrysoperla carnea]